MINSGIPYFPLDVALDYKFDLIEAEFGITGFAVVVKLFQKIYGGQGYYCEFTNEVALLFSRDCGLGGNVVSEIVTVSIKRGIFNKDLYEKYQILTSPGIQRRYFDAVKRRTQVDVKKEYLLIDVIQNYKNVNISGENVNINDRNVYISKQSREEKSKEEYSRGEERTELGSGKIRFAEFVSLTQKEYEQLGKQYGNKIEALIKTLNDWKVEKKKTCENDYKALTSWVPDRYKKLSVKPDGSSLKKQRYESKCVFDAEQATDLSWNQVENSLAEDRKKTKNYASMTSKKSK